MTGKFITSKLCNNASAISPSGISIFSFVLSFVFSLVFSFLFQSSYTSNVSAASITLSVPTTALSVDLDPSINGGFAVSSTSAVSVKTDGGWGYDFSIKSKTDSNALKNEASGGLLESISTPAGGIDENAFKTDGVYNNKWGFLPSKLNGAENIKYQAGPTTTPLVIDQTSAENSDTTSYDITIAAKADSTLSPGAYANTFVLTTTANAVSYDIIYDLNNGSWSGANQTGTTTDKTIILDFHEPTREDYEFKGWCDKATTDETCSGSQYSAGGTYALSSGSNTVTLYAMWEKINTEPAECQVLTEVGQTGTFTDPRDGSVYTIARLKDGKCWMTQNLRITGKTISSADSDMESGSYVIPASDSSKFNISDSLSNTYNEAVFYNGDVIYGAHYTWQTATASTGSDYPTQGQDAPSSICPKGWKLPTSGDETDSDYGKLVEVYGGDSSAGREALHATPYPNFTYAGYVLYSDGTLNGQGSVSLYWSSTAYDSTHAYYLLINSSSINPAYNNVRGHGMSVRCIAR